MKIPHVLDSSLISPIVLPNPVPSHPISPHAVSPHHISQLLPSPYPAFSTPLLPLNYYLLSSKPILVLIRCTNLLIHIRRFLPGPHILVDTFRRTFQAVQVAQLHPDQCVTVACTSSVLNTDILLFFKEQMISAAMDYCRALWSVYPKLIKQNYLWSISALAASTKQIATLPSLLSIFLASVWPLLKTKVTFRRHR